MAYHAVSANWVDNLERDSFIASAKDLKVSVGLVSLSYSVTGIWTFKPKRATTTR